MKIKDSLIIVPLPTTHNHGNSGLNILEFLIKTITAEKIEVTNTFTREFFSHVSLLENYMDRNIIADFIYPPNISSNTQNNLVVATEEYNSVVSSEDEWTTIENPMIHIMEVISREVINEKSATTILTMLIKTSDKTLSNKIANAWISQVTALGLIFDEITFNIITAVLSKIKDSVKNRSIITFVVTRLNFIPNIILTGFRWICVIEYAKFNLEWLNKNALAIATAGYVNEIPHTTIDLFKQIALAVSRGQGWIIREQKCLLIDIDQTLSVTNNKTLLTNGLVYKPTKVNNNNLVKAMDSMNTALDVFYVINTFKTNNNSEEENSEFVNKIITIVTSKSKRIQFTKDLFNEFYNLLESNFSLNLDKDVLRLMALS